MIVVDIAYPRQKAEFTKRFGLNAYWSGKDHHDRRRDAEELHAMMTAALYLAKVRRKPVDYPVDVTFLWDDRLDVDNHAAMGKCFLDAMRGHVVRDDSKRYVKSVKHQVWEGGRIRVIVEEAKKVRCGEERAP